MLCRNKAGEQQQWQAGMKHGKKGIFKIDLRIARWQDRAPAAKFLIFWETISKEKEKEARKKNIFCSIIVVLCEC
jgi:hypothetical protein